MGVSFMYICICECKSSTGQWQMFAPNEMEVWFSIM